MIFYYIVTHDYIQKAVKNETSQLAHRTDMTTPQGEVVNLFEEIAMDEHFDILFSRYFAEAQADVVTFIPPQYVFHTATDLADVYAEYPDYRKDRDFTLYLDMHCQFPPQYSKSIDTKVKQYFIDYIIWRWLETKLPQIALLFLERLEKLKEDILKLITKNYGPLRRIPSFP